MTATNRSALISKLYNALKKQYKVAPNPDRSLMENLLYACLLEGAPAELADEGIAKLEQQYFDWNEVRVTTVAEIAEVLASLPSPSAAASRLKRCLQSAFEAHYSFDLEELKKLNLGKAVEQLMALPGITPFVLAYVTQHSLGGHSIPVDAGGLRLLYVCGIIDQRELAAKRTPGLERAIPKNKGIDFGALLQQASSALMADPTDKAVRAIISSVNKQGLGLLDGADADKSIPAGRSPSEDQKRKTAGGKAAKPKRESAAVSEPSDQDSGSKRKESKSVTSDSAAAAKTPGKKVSKKTASAANAAKSSTKKSAPQKATPAKRATKKSATQKSTGKKAADSVKKQTPVKASASGKGITKRKPR